ncbi:FAD-dependent oxidoreductase [Candidatus Berkelbacteria bacterium]|nr:FAD-dependent oxidoreductase [Candidatus Berkelbacteria bacterium]
MGSHVAFLMCYAESMRKEGLKTILILGAGFAGVRCALELSKRSSQLQGYRIVLVNRHSYHLFTPWLYQRATTGAPADGLKIPLHTIFHRQSVELIVGEITQIDRARRMVALKSGQMIAYAYLVLALGSVRNDLGIPGIKQYGLALKSYADAEVIHEALKTRYRTFLGSAPPGSLFQVVVGGAGLTGVELTAELHVKLKQLAQGFGDSQERFVIKLLDADQRILHGLPTWMAANIQTRLGSFRHIQVMLQSRIEKVDRRMVTLQNGDRYEHELFIWTGGVAAHPLSRVCPVDRTSRIQVGMDLTVAHDDQTFAIGDIAICQNPKTHRESQQTIVTAYTQGALAARNIVHRINGEHLSTDHRSSPGYIVPVRGAWAVSSLGLPLVGQPAVWLLHAIHLRYFIQILPFPDAIKRWYTHLVATF